LGGTTMNLVFRHLYDDKWGCIQKPKYIWKRSTIVFPNNFSPETGKSYSCNVVATTATFVYNDTNYNVSIASLEDKASPVEEMHYKYKPRKAGKTAMQLAFEKAAQTINSSHGKENCNDYS
jgi:hypothetical protein